MQMLNAIKLYNNQFHSSIKTTPLEVEDGKIDEEAKYNTLVNAQRKRLKRFNKNREEYEEVREEGYIKNYESLRHKDAPKYRKYNLKNIHPTNIKRPLKILR